MGGCIRKHLYEIEKSKTAAIAPLFSSATSNNVSVRLFAPSYNYDTARIRMALQYKNVRVEAVASSPDNLNPKNIASTEASNYPERPYPTFLQHGKKNICGSIQTILEYIDNTFAVPPLVKIETHESYIKECSTFIKDDFTPLVWEALFEEDSHLQQDRAVKLNAAISRLDSSLIRHGSVGYFLGDNFSLIDIYIIPILEILHLLSNFRGIGVNLKHSHLLAYMKRMESFPCYSPVKSDMRLFLREIIKDVASRPSPVMISITCLQHRSISRHLQSLVDLASNIVEYKAEKNGHTTESTQMRLKKLWKGYCNTLELMQEHAQMEERVIFPVLEEAVKGTTEAVLGAHAKELPVMNGIREDIKAVMAIDLCSSFSNEAMTSVAKRLQTLQIYTAEHFYEEEIKLLPLLRASGLGNKQQEDQVHRCVSLMESTHAHLLPYLLVGLPPCDIFLYLIILQKCIKDENAFHKMIQVLLHAEGEFERVRRVVKDRLLSLQIDTSVL